MMFLADEAATQAAGASLGGLMHTGDVIALSGPLGAGKTCFVRGLLGALGYAGDVPSPTFGIVIPYAPPDVRIPVWHVDLYRIDNSDDILELGLDDARGDAALVIEWPQRMGSALWADALQIELGVEANGRRLTAKVPASWEARCPFR
jgi:tRNA threonylcarbamoyladenosine biosynthesis protein TsaE